MDGKDFEQCWQQAAMAGLQSALQQISFGSIQPDTRIQRNETVQKHLRMAARRGFEIQWLKATISGSRYGQAYRGMVFILHTKASNRPHMETLQVAIAISPAHQLSRTLAVYEGVDNSFQPNPQYEQRLCRIQRQQRENFGVDGGHGADHQYQERHLSRGLAQHVPGDDGQAGSISNTRVLRTFPFKKVAEA